MNWKNLLIFGSIVSQGFTSFAGGPKVQALPVHPDQVRFEFASQDGEIQVPCKHDRKSDFNPDFSVFCGDREFTVHLYVTTYRRPVAPKMSYEILYWVTNHKASPGTGAKYPGSTIWFRLKEPSALHELDLSQDIEDTFVLRARVIPPS